MDLRLLPGETDAAGAGEGMSGARDVQVGGEHYRAMQIRPVEYIVRNGIGFAGGAVIKYVSRWKAKGGIEDLRKARHMLDLLIELEVNRDG